MLKRTLVVFLFMLVITTCYIIVRNLSFEDHYHWYDGLGISALAAFFYWVLIASTTRKDD